jgi:hypothetical protein
MMSESDDDKQSNTGCLYAFHPFLILVVLALFDALGCAVSCAGGYGPAVLALAFLGFCGGAALGRFLFARTVPRTVPPLGYLLLWGLLGLAIPTIIANFLYR